MGIMEKKTETTMVCWVFRGVAAACVNQAIGLACRAARCPVRNLVICGFGKGANWRSAGRNVCAAPWM